MGSRRKGMTMGRRAELTRWLVVEKWMDGMDGSATYKYSDDDRSASWLLWMDGWMYGSEGMEKLMNKWVGGRTNE